MSLSPTLSGPSRSPASGKPAKQLVVFLHGVGADGNDLIGLAPYFAKALPDAAFLSPDGPFPCDLGPFGRQWFSLQDRTPSVIAAGVRKASPILNAYLDAQLAERGLTDDKLALVGFSQGTMMALYVAPRRAKSCAGVVGFSGALVDGEKLKQEQTAKPPVLLIHGDADMVVDSQCLSHAAKTLESAGLKVTARLHPGLGHSIDEPGLQAAIQFLTVAFG